MQRSADVLVPPAGEAGPAPEEFRALRAGPCFLLVAAPFEAVARGLGLLEPGSLELLLAEASGPQGRARTAVIPLEGRCERLHLRPVRHGGALAGLWGDRLLGLRRPSAELRTNARLRARGAPVPRPVLVAGQRRSGPFWRAAVATLHEENAVDGVVFLAGAPRPERLLRACSAVGSAVRALHDTGGRHRDLHVKNVLVREAGSETQALLIDLDRARLVPELNARARMAEIMRLYRSLVKRGLVDVVGREGCQAFLSSYTEGDQSLGSALLAHLPRERRRLAMHRLGHRLSGAAQRR